MATVRRQFTAEYKRDAIRMVSDKGMSYSEVARKLGISESLLRRWKKMHDAQGEQAFPGHGQQPALEAELTHLRAENKRLKSEQELLKKAAAYFARELL